MSTTFNTIVGLRVPPGPQRSSIRATVEDTMIGVKLATSDNTIELTPGEAEWLIKQIENAIDRHRSRTSRIVADQS